MTWLLARLHDVLPVIREHDVVDPDGYPARTIADLYGIGLITSWTFIARSTASGG